MVVDALVVLLLAACRPMAGAPPDAAAPDAVALAPPTGAATAQSSTMAATSGHGPYPTPQPWQQATIDAYRATHAAGQGRNYQPVPTVTPVPPLTPGQAAGVAGFLVGGAALAVALAVLVGRRALRGVRR